VHDKDPDEIAALKDVAERTNIVMGEVVASSRRTARKDGMLVKDDGSALTVGDAKRHLRAQLQAHGSKTTASRSSPSGGMRACRTRTARKMTAGAGQGHHLRLFPRALDTGYLHDMTRTFCLGFARRKSRRRTGRPRRSSTR